MRLGCKQLYMYQRRIVRKREPTSSAGVPVPALPRDIHPGRARVVATPNKAGQVGNTFPGDDTKKIE
eukprot:696129-Prymnesium_polylepis.1